jgi:hypothetical protein
VWVADRAGPGRAKVTFSFDAWEGGNVAPSTIEIPVAESSLLGRSSLLVYATLTLLAVAAVLLVCGVGLRR